MNMGDESRKVKANGVDESSSRISERGIYAASTHKLSARWEFVAPPHFGR